MFRGWAERSILGLKTVGEDMEIETRTLSPEERKRLERVMTWAPRVVCNVFAVPGLLLFLALGAKVVFMPHPNDKVGVIFLPLLLVGFGLGLRALGSARTRTALAAELRAGTGTVTGVAWSKDSGFGGPDRVALRLETPSGRSCNGSLNTYGLPKTVAEGDSLKLWFDLTERTFFPDELDARYDPGVVLRR